MRPIFNITQDFKPKIDVDVFKDILIWEQEESLDSNLVHNTTQQLLVWQAQSNLKKLLHQNDEGLFIYIIGICI